MMVAKNLKKGRKGIASVKRVEPGKAKQVDKRLENVNEGKYHDWRNDETLSPKQKIGKSMMEVRDTLRELEKMVKMNVRLKNELNVDSRGYWKRTHSALQKISERLVKLANKVGQLK
jgi:Mg2+ and Co2+ transporter CorA